MKINLASTRFAFFLIAALALLIIVSAVVPQQGIADDQMIDWRAVLGRGYVVIEKLQIDRIYTSPVFLGTVALLSMNLVAGNIQRIGRLVRIHSLRGRLRVLGSILFHFSLLVVVVGSSLNHLYRSRVVFGLTEGQEVRDQPRAYFRDFSGPLSGETSGRFTLRLERIDPEWPVGDVTTEAAEIRISGSIGDERGIVRVNHPVRNAGLEFHLGALIGYSPELVVTDTSGHERFRSFVRLSRRQEHGEIVDSDFVFLPGDSTRVQLRIASADTPDGAPRTAVTVERAGFERYNGYPGSSGAVTADGWRVAVPRLRRWCYVEVIRNPFMNVVFAGFWAALGSLVVTLVPRLMPAGRKVS